MKLVFTLAFAMFMVGCATKGEVSSLQSDVTALQSVQSAQADKIKELGLEQEIINGKIAAIEKSHLKMEKEHELMIQRLNKVFTRSQSK